MSHKLLIDGELTDGELSLPVINPATGAVWTHVPRASKAQAERAIAAAKRAQPLWAARSLDERRQAVLKLADLIEARSEELARSLVLEQGKPLPEASAEVMYTAIFLRAFAGMDLPVEVVQDDEQLRIEVHHKPLGVVAGITPWNFPLLIGAYKLAPAVLLGNTFILKPAPTTPVSSLILGEAAAEAFPPGVVNVIVDDNDIGPLLTGHPDIAKISFTGSTPTGRRIMAHAADTLKRLTLELGGNDAAIVLEGTDPEAAAQKIYQGAFFNAGQVCIAIKRVYAHKSVYDPLCNALGELARNAVVGDGLEQGVTMGPLQNAAQYEKAQRYLEIAKRDGTVAGQGKVPDGPGYFIAPTVVRDIDGESPLVEEEQFAPILPVVSFDDLEPVIAKVNAGEYGLGGSVWSPDLERAYDVALRLNSGTTWINHHLHFAPHVPFPGAKASGLGVEFSAAGFAEFAQKSVISMSKPAS